MSSPITFVNIIDVDPDTQQEVIDLLNEGAEQVMMKRRGFISVTIFASVDKRRIVNVARWETADAVKATQADPVAAEFAKRTAALASPSGGLYVVAGEYTL